MHAHPHTRFSSSGKLQRCRPALLLAGLLGMAAAPAAMALDLQRQYTFAGGSLPGVIVPLSMWDPELKGIVQVNWLLATAELSHRNHYFAYDTELYFSGLPDIGLPRDLSRPPVSESLAPTQLRYALPGNAYQPRAGYRYDFLTGNATGGTFKGAVAKPVDTTDSGLYVHLMNWTGDPGTSMDITSTKLTFGLTITRYQLFANPNVDGISVQRGDQAYNAEQFDNRGSVTFDDQRLVNRSQGEWSNHGSLQAAATGQVFVNDGGFVNEKGGSVSSALTNTGTIYNLGQWTVSSTAPLSLFDNQGRINGAGDGRFTIAGGVTFSNAAEMNLSDDAGIVVDGTLHNQGDAATATIALRDAGRLLVRGKLVSDGEIQLHDKAALTVDGGATVHNNARLEAGGKAGLFITGNWINLATASGVALKDDAFLQVIGQMQNYGSFTLGDRAFVNNVGAFDNRSARLVLEGGEFRNLGSGSLTNHGELYIRSGGFLRNTATLAVFAKSRLEVAGRLESSTTITNVADASLAIAPGGTVTATVVNQGRLVVAKGGLLNSRAEFRQTGGWIVVDGVLQADVVRIDGGLITVPGTLRSSDVRLGPGTVLGRFNPPV